MILVCCTILFIMNTSQPTTNKLCTRCTSSKYSTEEQKSKKVNSFSGWYVRACVRACVAGVNARMQGSLVSSLITLSILPSASSRLKGIFGLSRVPGRERDSSSHDVKRSLLPAAGVTRVCRLGRRWLRGRIIRAHCGGVERQGHLPASDGSIFNWDRFSVTMYELGFVLRRNVCRHHR